jgi:hypothetical protein
MSTNCWPRSLQANCESQMQGEKLVLFDVSGRQVVPYCKRGDLRGYAGDHIECWLADSNNVIAVRARAAGQAFAVWYQGVHAMANVSKPWPNVSKAVTSGNSVFTRADYPWLNNC